MMTVLYLFFFLNKISHIFTVEPTYWCGSSNREIISPIKMSIVRVAAEPTHHDGREKKIVPYLDRTEGYTNLHK